jgi:YidC/Oxa1 family membrane protein insertase
MITTIYHTVFYQPLYNGLVFLLSITPSWFDIGMAIIVFTIIVKLILFPLSKASIHNQIKMKELEPRIAEIKQKYKDQEQQIKILALYRDHKLNPFLGILLLLIQVPIIIALYRLFLTGGLPQIKLEMLYSFVHAPGHALKMVFFDMDISKKSVLLALCAAATQFFQIRLSIPEIKTSATTKGSLTQDMSRTLNMQMRYVLPLFVFFISWSINAAVAIYWTTSNLFAIAQELFVRRRLVDQSQQRLKESLIIK